MKINTDINILGGMADWRLIITKAEEQRFSQLNSPEQRYSVKTEKSFNRFNSAIDGTVINFKNERLKILVTNFLHVEDLSSDALLLLFWNSALNNELFKYVNDNAFFPAFYSGRVSLRNKELEACLKDLKQSENELKTWSESTITTTASKYLTLLKKFGLMEGAQTKTIKHPYLPDKMLVLFIYWYCAAFPDTDILSSSWLQYSFMEKSQFLERVLTNRIGKYVEINFNAVRLKMQPLLTYENIYDELAKH